MVVDAGVIKAVAENKAPYTHVGNFAKC